MFPRGRSIDDVNDLVHHVIDVIVDVADVAREVRDVIGEAADVIDRVRDVMRDVPHLMHQVGDVIDDVGDVTREVVDVMLGVGDVVRGLLDVVDGGHGSEGVWCAGARAVFPCGPTRPVTQGSAVPDGSTTHIAWAGLRVLRCEPAPAVGGKQETDLPHFQRIPHPLPRPLPMGGHRRGVPQA